MKHKLVIMAMMAMATCWVRGEDLLKISMDSAPTNGRGTVWIDDLVLAKEALK